VTDIEGTTTSIGFVHNVLFPYAAKRLPDFIREREDEPEIAGLLEDVRAQAGEPQADRERLIQVLLEWIAEDRKATPLKALQGLVWKDGYENGDFTGHVYADTAPAFRRWRERGAVLYIYSSGSVKAQQLLFGHSDAGDLRPLIAGYFDTAVGHKREADSYRTIAEQIGQPAKAILFLSDVTEELDAAASAGMRTLQLARDEPVRAGSHPLARDFTEVTI
ncbi:MAG TPA: acireductone synthase, partial [Woeseiaceae bacterium]|nr:acireductone synthase [Woeseiaceae bacterium]